ncbi:MAG: glycosyltransferase family 2 protein [Terracidiphilus sp.]
MTNKPSIAIVVLTYNEARHLPRALDHLSSFAQQVFVIDSYSSDDTVELAQARGAQILQHPFCNQAKQFEWALENAPITAEWVMRLDADEIVESDLAAEIIIRLPQLPPDVTGVNLNRKTIFQGRFLRHGGRYPLRMLRIWRRGKARVEDRWMDEHIYLTEGRSIDFSGGFADYSLIDLTEFTEKHNRYASREAIEVLTQRFNLAPASENAAVQTPTKQLRAKRFTKALLYDRLPFEISAIVYFLYRYFFRLGFLDGREGLLYHVLQGFWYRFLVGAKVRELEPALRSASSDEERRAVIARFTRIQLPD